MTGPGRTDTAPTLASRLAAQLSVPLEDVDELCVRADDAERALLQRTFDAEPGVDITVLNWGL
ncbi:hypothetical protein RYH80_18040 [Halobaculum sp. MBLA0147]|uniref:hypothetical protein n=1 Tax=Halobaculum sp. MBLA0147 TaxID=3079934 RepID=UPI003526548C